MTVSSWALPRANRPGEKVRLSNTLVEGKETILFFHASWSKTSGRYLVELERWQKTHQDQAIVLVDVKNLKSPVAKQFQLDAVPAFRVYDKKGELTASGQPAFHQVTELLKR